MTTVYRDYLTIVDGLKKHGIEFEDTCDNIWRLLKLYEDYDDRIGFVIEQLEYMFQMPLQVIFTESFREQQHKRKYDDVEDSDSSRKKSSPGASTNAIPPASGQVNTLREVETVVLPSASGPSNTTRKVKMVVSSHPTSSSNAPNGVVTIKGKDSIALLATSDPLSTSKKVQISVTSHATSSSNAPNGVLGLAVNELRSRVASANLSNIGSPASYTKGVDVILPSSTASGVKIERAFLSTSGSLSTPRKVDAVALQSNTARGVKIERALSSTSGTSNTPKKVEAVTLPPTSRPSNTVKGVHAAVFQQPTSTSTGVVTVRKIASANLSNVGYPASYKDYGANLPSSTTSGVKIERTFPSNTACGVKIERALPSTSGPSSTAKEVQLAGFPHPTSTSNGPNGMVTIQKKDSFDLSNVGYPASYKDYGANLPSNTPRKVEAVPFPSTSGPSNTAKVAHIAAPPHPTSTSNGVVTVGKIASANLSNVGTPASYKDYGANLPGSVQSQLKKDTPLESRLDKATRYHKIFLNHFPNIHVNFAAFKAAEMALENGSDLGLETFLANWGVVFKMVWSNENWTMPRWENAEGVEMYNNTMRCFMDEQLSFFILSIPDADPDYLSERVRQTQGNQALINDLLTELTERKDYPSRNDYNVRKEIEELPKKIFTAGELLDMYEDPFKHFYDLTRMTNAKYRAEALELLKSDFRLSSVWRIKESLKKHNFLFAPTHYDLKNTVDWHPLKSKRQLRHQSPTDVFLIEEIAFVQNQTEIHDYLKAAEDIRRENVGRERQKNALLECSICCEDELLETDFVSCDAGHRLCTSCVRRHSEEQIGIMKNHVFCMETDCKQEYSLSVLKAVLRKSVYERFEKRRQAEEVLAAGIEGLESCPFCDYCEVPPEGDRLFQCQNPGCRKVSCRQCREASHLPLRCEEVAMQLRLRTYVEAKMTEALVRECPKCARKFVKTEGCNKMTCPCGARMCYLCRQLINDYDHFAGANDPNKNKCPLFSDNAKLHEEEVVKSENIARAELAAANPNIAIDFVLRKKVLFNDVIHVIQIRRDNQGD